MPLTQGQKTFLVGCMGTRALLVYLAATVPPAALRVMGVMGGVIACGFAVIYAGKLRATGVETGGQPIWWDFMRPVHALMYAAFAYLALTGAREAWVTLLIDAVIGMAAFVMHHFV